MNTAPGFPNAAQMAQAFASGGPSVKHTYNDRCEVYIVKPAVWKAARMADYGGCFCIGCLEKRLGRKLRPKDFMRGNELNLLPGTDRLLSRRMGM
jgi:hypothetical protein